MVTKLYEMANVSKDDTGLPYNIWIDSGGRQRKTRHKIPRIKVEVNGKLIPVSVSDDPKILVNKSIPKFNEIRKYIIKYEYVFLKHWNKEITDREALNLLNK